MVFRETKRETKGKPGNQRAIRQPGTKKRISSNTSVLDYSGVKVAKL
jgi:hypothetical protein